MMDENTTRELVDRARAGDHIKFQFIHNLGERFAAKKIFYAIKSVANGFAITADHILAEYLSEQAKGNDRIDLIISYKQVMDCCKFYLDDAAILKDMIKEYRCYVFSGHIFSNIICGRARPEEDEIDWRTLPVKWF